MPLSARHGELRVLSFPGLAGKALGQSSSGHGLAMGCGERAAKFSLALVNSLLTIQPSPSFSPAETSEDRLWHCVCLCASLCVFFDKSLVLYYPFIALTLTSGLLNAANVTVFSLLTVLTLQPMLVLVSIATV